MSAPSSDENRPVLMVGATGDLGGRAVRALLARGKSIRALVRPGSDVSGLPTEKVQVVRGDMLDPTSLGPAMEGVSAVVSTAIGYSGRRDTDSLRTDTEGNRNLVDAAKKASVPRFVFQSILACDLATDVPHFWAKKETEDYLVQQGVPFVALRPGAFLGSWMARTLQHGQFVGMTPAGVRITYIRPDEVARALALAVDEPRALNGTVDLGCDRPLSGPELKVTLETLLGRPLQDAPMQGRGGASADMMAMFRFFQTGKYVADTRRQAELFGPVPKIEDSVRSMLVEIGLLPAPPAQRPS
jgi:uncharacterized protein YbjT (DUF2867 family)